MKPLSQFSDQHLDDRLQGLARNMFFNNGKLCFPSHIRELFDETFTEVKRRGPLPRLKVEEWIKPIDNAPQLHSNSLIRYAKRNRLMDLLAGKVSFATAGIYGSLSNEAQRDNELSRSTHLQDQIVNINGFEYPTTDIVMNWPIEAKGGGNAHYHFLSFAKEESPKLQRAFNQADGYVVVKDVNAFWGALRPVIREKFPDAECQIRSIKYYDDRATDGFETASDLLFSKSIHYQYQWEVRFAIFGTPQSENRIEVDVKWPPGIFSAIKSFL